MKNRIFYLIILILAEVPLFSQSINQTEFAQDGNNIIVTYSLNLPMGKVVDVEMFVSNNGGATFNGPLKAVTGDVGRISTSGKKTITWSVFDEYRTLEGNIMFQVRATAIKEPVPQEFFVAYNVSGSSQYGLTLGTVGKWGWYLRIKTNACFEKTNYKSDFNGVLNYDGDGYYVFTNLVKRSRIGLTAGFIQNIYKNIYIYGGAGYGERVVLWNLDEFSYSDNLLLGDFWAENTYNTFKGVELEAGLFYRYKMLNFSLGCNTLNFDFFEINAGLGISF